ncbi:putative restriction endonuclease [Flavobacterium gossypii]|uniref:Restriction endonuclease n=1 Tax=Flavobacterium gossypii TaxID=1646119 RepID=A0ABR6DP72_9FLAO|nr:HNH endonuclease [Flavobacterium gossypii]MBA9073495.1 putative restriction endonuclease [Flavobacterium gossypii]
MAKNLWTREELILAFNLYLKIEFGKTYAGNPKIIELANIVGRTPASIVMRLANFASIDPYHQERGVGGLKNGMNQVKPIWDEFFNNQEELVFLSEEILAQKQNLTIESKYHDLLFDLKGLKGETKIREVKTRVNQYVFREMVMVNYASKCAITGIDIPDLLHASHIIPWSQSEKERLNPENGICLSALYDKAFDKGYIGLDKDYKVLLSSSLKKKKDTEYYSRYFAPIENTAITTPIKYQPRKEFLEYHLDTIFDKR